MTEARRPSIARPIFLLVIAAIVLANAITFVITFAGPPPRPAPVALSNVAAALGGRAQVNPEGDTIRATVGTAPRPRAHERRDPRRDAQLTVLLGRGTVRGYYSSPARGADGAIRGDFTIGWRDGGVWRVVTSLPDRLFARWLMVTLGAMLLATVVMGAAAWLIVRAISGPLGALAQAAQTARMGTPIPAPATGARREVAALTTALAEMQRRIEGQAAGRTAMLAAIAHDLGTPLSRIAFWIEQLPDAARDRAAADIEEMRAMLGEVLRFARDERIGTRDRIDLGSVIDSLVEDLRAVGQPVALEPGPRVLVSGDGPALRRLFGNLIENAIRYGERARVGWSVAADRVTVVVADDGPGFDPALGERAFEPFVRGDPSRNRATGGSGLGLAIVRALAEAHGGSATIGGGEGSGVVMVTLPLA